MRRWGSEASEDYDGVEHKAATSASLSKHGGNVLTDLPPAQACWLDSYLDVDCGNARHGLWMGNVSGRWGVAVQYARR